MLRLLVIGLIVFFSILVLIISVVIVARIWKWFGYNYQSLINYFTHRKQKHERSARNKLLPSFMKKGIAQFDHSLSLMSELSHDWQEQLVSIASRAEAVIEMSAQKKKQARQIRTFFTVSLPAFERLIMALQADANFMTDAEAEKVRLNIKILERDFTRHYEQISDSRKFDFDVVMESIKQRIKYR